MKITTPIAIFASALLCAAAPTSAGEPQARAPIRAPIYLAIDDLTALETGVDASWLRRTRAWAAAEGLDVSDDPPPSSVAVTPIDAADGISLEEAQRLATAYFSRYVGCGSLSGVSDAGAMWKVDGRFGYAGTPIRDFVIDKRSGAIRSSIGPSYDDPNRLLHAAPSLFVELLWHERMRVLSEARR